MNLHSWFSCQLLIRMIIYQPSPAFKRSRYCHSHSDGGNAEGLGHDQIFSREIEVEIEKRPQDFPNKIGCVCIINAQRLTQVTRALVDGGDHGHEKVSEEKEYAMTAYIGWLAGALKVDDLRHMSVKGRLIVASSRFKIRRLLGKIGDS